MPFVSLPTLKDLMSTATTTNGIVCMQMDERRGFPMVSPCRVLSRVQSELSADRRSLHALFHHPETQVFQWSEDDWMEAFNINTPSEFEAARNWVKEHDLDTPVLSRRANLSPVLVA